MQVTTENAMTATKAKTYISLEALERMHSEALLDAGRAPAGSAAREEFLRKADALLRKINEACENANRTPFA